MTTGILKNGMREERERVERGASEREKRASLARMGNEESRPEAGEVLTKNVDKRTARKHHRDSFQLAIDDWRQKKLNPPKKVPGESALLIPGNQSEQAAPRVMEIDFSPSSPPPPPADSPGKKQSKSSSSPKSSSMNKGKAGGDRVNDRDKSGSSKGAKAVAAKSSVLSSGARDSEGGHRKHLTSLKQRASASSVQRGALKGRSVSTTSQDSQPPPPPPSGPPPPSPKNSGDKFSLQSLLPASGSGRNRRVASTSPSSSLGPEESRVSGWFESICARDPHRAQAFLVHLEKVYSEHKSGGKIVSDDLKDRQERRRMGAPPSISTSTTPTGISSKYSNSSRSMGGTRSKSQPNRSSAKPSSSASAEVVAARASRKKYEADLEELKRLTFRDPLAPKRVSVCVRKRPMFAHEREDDFDAVDASGLLGEQSLVVFDTRMKADMRGMKLTPHVFAFDHVFKEDASNGDVFNTVAHDLVDHALGGKFASAFMFGATGSGKTHTMSGVVELAAAKIFKRVERKLAQGVKARVTLAMFELYGSKCRDLLSSAAQAKLSSLDYESGHKLGSSDDDFGSSGSSEEDGKRQQHEESGGFDDGLFRLLEGKDGALLFDGLTEKDCLSEAVFLGEIEQGQRARVTTETGVHDQSSRSHAFYRVQVVCGSKSGELLLVDLAGSERNKDSFKHDHALQMECAEINTSLMALKNCFRAQSAGESFVPYRASLLTRILKQGLVDPDAKTAIIATVAPSSSDTEHTLSTLNNVSAMLASDNHDGDSSSSNSNDNTKKDKKDGKGKIKTPINSCKRSTAIHHCKLGTEEIKSIASQRASQAYEQARMENPKRWSPLQLQEWWRKHAPSNIEPPPNVSGEMMARWPQNRFVQYCTSAVAEESSLSSSSSSQSGVSASPLKGSKAASAASPSPSSSSSPRASASASSPASKARPSTGSAAMSPAGRRSSAGKGAMKPSPSHKQAALGPGFYQRRGEELYHLFREEILRLGKQQHRRAQANRS